MLVDDDRGSRDTVKAFLHMLGHEVVEYGSGVEGLAALPNVNVSLVMSDVKMPCMTGIALVSAITKLSLANKPPVVLFTGYGTMESAIAAMRAGAFDYLLKPINAAAIVEVIERVERELPLSTCTIEAKKGHKVEVGSQQLDVFSPVMEDLVRQALVFHNHRDIPILISGETGTGKELIARLIHYGKHNETRPFVDINCAAIASSLFESELFGYVAGTFTGGRVAGGQGKVDLAQGGTLFLDEVAEIPFTLQSKLLRFIQEKEFYRVGGLKKIKTDVRIISATNQNIEKAVNEGRFRKDLYYRLKVGQLVIPPIRQRKNEIIPLTHSFLLAASRRREKHFSSISNEAKLILEEYSWPGNVRELINLIELIVLLYNDEILGKTHLNAIMDQRPNRMLTMPPIKNSTISRRISYEEIIAALEATKGNKKAAAQYLGISRRTLYRLFEKNNM
jgi:DNA-binding NtrC family response regulator